MEDILTQLMNDASSPKYASVKKSCQAALELLENTNAVSETPAYDLREKCLEPFQLALETKAKKLASYAISGIQQIMKDDRFQSSIESENEEKWLPIQVLNTVFSTPTLPEDIQVEIMKLLLNMTFSTAWCMNAKVITRVTQVYIDTYTASSHSVRGAVKAASTQLLSSFVEKLHKVEDEVVEDGSDILADFKAKGNSNKISMTNDIVAILKFFTEKLEQASTISTGPGRQAIPLLLEGVYTIISGCPPFMRDNKIFQEILWKHLCPTLISLLGTPKSERSMQKSLSREDIGRGSGCSLTAPNLQVSTAKTVYNIAVSLVGLMGSVGSLRPMLESVFHRMLLYPPPQHRLDALKAVKELLKNADSLCNLAVPPSDIDYSEKSMMKNPNADISLLKLMVDSIEESCHCNDSSVCITSVMCIDAMLGALEQISKGVGITEPICTSVNKYYLLLDKGFTRSDSCSDYDGGASDLDRKGSVSSTQSHDAEVKDNKISSEDERANEVSEKSQDSSVEPIENCEDTNELDPNLGYNLHRQEQIKQQTMIREEIKKRFNKLGSEYEAVERQNARELITELSKVLPHISQMMSVTEVDGALQEFASNFCIALYKNQSSDNKENVCHMAILNADGVYVTTIAALLLNLKLHMSGYYNTHDVTTLQMTEKEFLDDILGSGLLLFLSPSWLSEIYEQITTNNLLQQTNCLGSPDLIIVQLLKDIDGLNSYEIGSQLLSHTTINEELDDISTEGVHNEQFVETGKKLAKRILSKCWDGVLEVLSVLLNGKSSCGISSSLGLMLGTEGAKEESIRAREAIVMSLDGLQKAARLCCTLGLQQRCGSVFSQLASTSCVLFDAQKSPLPETKSSHKPPSSTKPNKPVRLHAAHVLSMDVVMTTGLEMGSHSADCWKHVFRCSAFISELEHTYFSRGNNQSSLPKLQQEQTTDIQDQDGCDPELYSVPVTAAVPVAPRINIPNLIKQSSIESGWDRSLSGGGVLNSAQASQALCGLSQEVDRLFEDAAEKLNLCALLNFLSELSESGRLQLIKVMKHKEDEDFSTESQQLPPNALHLYRLQEVLMKVVFSDRPYIHMMRCWSVVSSFLVEAAGHHDRSVSKMAVTCVHDFILAMLGNHPELPHFHVNELLCKTFENMLCLELCDGDVQDQIVCSICELVEACTADIRSGWRPLFGALRAVKIEYTTNEEVNEARQRHIAAVLDVFEVYLNTDNILVFANAAVDCILCLLKYVRGPGEFEDLSDDDSDSGSDFDVSAPSGENLCVPALGYLQQCSKILQRMWKMPACPVFNGAHRIHTDSDQHFVDSSIPNMDMEEFMKIFTEKPSETAKASGDNSQSEVISMATKSKNLAIQRSLDEEDRLNDSGSITSTDSGISSMEKQPNNAKTGRSEVKVKCDVNLDMLDNHSGILHVWFLLLDGMASSVSSCPRNYQPDTLEMLFELLGSASKVPGPKFAIYCVNHLLLPMLQTWLRTGARKHGYWDTGAMNFKQCCGLCTDLIVDLVQEFSGYKSDIVAMVEMMLKQLLDVLIECIAQPVEVISRLGCSCIRHLFLSAGHSFTEEMWQIGGEAMQKALNTSTFYIQQLMVLFQVNSENFYGDLGQVKVAMRQDSTPMECERLKHLAHQVFLLDSQVSGNVSFSQETEEDKSFVFLLYAPGCENSLNPDDIVTRIPFPSVVIGLLSNQLLIQTIGSILLSNDNMTPRTEHHQSEQNGDSTKKTTHQMPGMLPLLSTRNVVTFLKCLRSSYKLAGEFDSRPGLKFLVQKVARTSVAVNLYKQAGASMIFYIHTLIQIGASFTGLSRKEIREILSGIHQKDLDIYNVEIESASHRDKLSSSPKVFMQLLTRVCDELCQTYVDILNDDCIVDQMAEQQVFFLIAQPDDISDLVRRKKEQPTDDQPHTVDVVQPGVYLQEDAVCTQVAQPVQQDRSEEDEETDDRKSQISDSDKSRHSMKSKRELREEQESKVYTLATDTLIKSLMTAYKKHKQHYAMPSFVKIRKQKKSTPPSKKTDVDEVIEKQQKSSTMKDSEARKQSWTELLCTILELFQQLPDDKFDSLMPTVFYCVNQLVCHADEHRLKDALGQWLHRVGVMMELAPP